MNQTHSPPANVAELRDRLAERDPADSPEPGRPNRYAASEFLSHDAAEGCSTTAHGDRLLWLAPRELATVVANADPESLRRAGYAAGLSQMERFVPRAEAEFGLALTKINLGRVVQTWWWPFRAAGWGRWRIDLSRQARGVIVTEIESPPWGENGAGVAEFLAGMFAAVFGYLAGRELACLPLPGTAASAVFLVSTRKTVRAAEAVVAETGPLPVDEILSRIPPREPTT